MIRDFAAGSDAVVEAHGAQPLAWYVTEPAENTFAALPVRTDVSVLVSLTAFDDEEHHRAFGAGHGRPGGRSARPSCDSRPRRDLSCAERATATSR